MISPYFKASHTTLRFDHGFEHCGMVAPPGVLLDKPYVGQIGDYKQIDETVRDARLGWIET